MRRLSLILLFLSIFFSVPSVQAAKLVSIDKVRITSTALVLGHNSEANLKFKKRVYGSPPRLVFDILDSDLKGSKQVFPVNKYDISQIRVGQFEPTIVRVVVEGASTSALEKIKIENIGQNVFFKFGVADVVVEDIQFEKGNLFLRANGPIQFNKILLKDPERLVIDIIGAKLKSNSLKRKFKNGDEEIKSAQFDKSTVRLVFKGAKVADRGVNLSGADTELIISGEDFEKKDKKKKKKTLKEKIYDLQLIERSDNESVFLIKSTKKINYEFLKLHNPERLVLDLFNIAFEEELMATQFRETAHVKDIRFGLATLGTPVTRVVFDLKSNGLMEEFQLNASGTELRVKVTGDSKKASDIPQAVRSKGKIVVIDPGHGGYDPGAMYGGYNEKDLTLSMSMLLKKYLQDAGIKAYMTRTDDRYVSLAERVEISNSVNPAIFVSVHANALATNTKMDGLQTYYYSSNGLKIATVTHNQMLEDVGMTNRNIRRARFWVCKYTKAPSILVETGFMTNPKERAKLVKRSYQEKIAKSLARGIIKYLEKH